MAHIVAAGNPRSVTSLPHAAWAATVTLIAVALGGSLWAWIDPMQCGSCSGAADLVGGLPLAGMGTLFYALLLALMFRKNAAALARHGIALAAAIHAMLMLTLAWHSLFCAPCLITGSAVLAAFVVSRPPLASAPLKAALCAAAMLAALMGSHETERSPLSADLASPLATQATDSQRAELLIMTRDGCHFCEQLEQEVLPDIVAEFGDRIHVTRVPAPAGVPSPTIIVNGKQSQELVGLPRKSALRGAVSLALGDARTVSPRSDSGSSNVLGFMFPHVTESSPLQAFGAKTWRDQVERTGDLSAPGATFYVAKNGSDANTCAQAQNPATPKLSVRAALACVGGDAQGDTSGAGRTVVVAPGVYDEELYAVIPGGSSDASPFTLRCSQRGACTFRPTRGACGGLPCHGVLTEWAQYIVIDGFVFDASNTQYQGLNIYGDHMTVQYSKIYNPMFSCILSGASYGKYLHLELERCGIRNPPYHADQGGPNDIYLGGNYNEVGYVYLHDASAGIAFWNDISVPSYNVAHHNFIAPAYPNVPGRIVGNGLGMYRGPGNKAFNNILVGGGIVVAYGCTDCQVINNAVYNDFDPFGGIAMYIEGSATRTVVKNNLLYLNTTAILDQGSGTIKSNNLTSNPLFVNAGGNDFRLQAGSPAIDAGANVSSYGVTTDYADAPRPRGAAYDVGAYEFGGGASSPVPAPAPAPVPAPGPAPASASLTVSATSIQPSASMTVTVANGPGNALDWVGLYAVGASAEQFLDWKYLNNSQNPPASGVKSATLAFQMPNSGGSYQFRLFPQDGFSPTLATSPTVAVSSAPSPAPAPAPAPTSSQSPFSGTAMAIPGTIASAQYDNGGEGVAFHDTDSVNQMSSTYRAGQGVDSNGAGVGWIHAGEWLEYTVNVSAAGSYTITIPVSQTSAGGSMHVSFNGVNVTGAMNIPNTGGWDTYQNIIKTVNLSAGTQVVQIMFDAAGANGYGPGLRDVTVSGSGGAGGTGLSAQYFDNLDFTGATFTRTDATVNFDWGMGAPTGSMGVDYFSVRWAGQVQAQYSQTYTFYVTGDDGVRLWVNGHLLIDKWLVQSPKEYAATINLTAGAKYDIKLEYYENFGGAVAQLRWSSPSIFKQIIPTSQLHPPAVVAPTGKG